MIRFVENFMLKFDFTVWWICSETSVGGEIENKGKVLKQGNFLKLKISYQTKYLVMLCECIWLFKTLKVLLSNNITNWKTLFIQALKKPLFKYIVTIFPS